MKKCLEEMEYSAGDTHTYLSSHASCLLSLFPKGVVCDPAKVRVRLGVRRSVLNWPNVIDTLRENYFEMKS